VKRDANAVFEGSIPENYDRYLGPGFFQPFAKDLVARLERDQPKRVLEIACGTGIVTRELRDRLPFTTQIVATDLNPAMFTFAQRKFGPDENVEWQEADAAALPFPDGSFDAVICQFGLMFVPDKEAAMRECHRVLVRGGAFLFNVWDSMDQNPVVKTGHQTIVSFFERDPPNFYELPFGFYDQNVIRPLLENAGFRGIEVSLLTLPFHSSSAQDFATGLVRGNPVATATQERGANVDHLVHAVAERIAERYGSAPMKSTMQAFVWRALRE
jgi:ubiquinone/menaquinone biosynthesis C-methylase UbiE